MINGLVKFDILPSGNASIEFMVENNLEIHRTKYSNSERYFKNNCIKDPLRLLPLKENKFDLDGINLFYLKGLGLIKVKGSGKVVVNVNDRIKIYTSEVNL